MASSLVATLRLLPSFDSQIKANGQTWMRLPSGEISLFWAYM